MEEKKPQITLWLLNRCVQWERDEPQLERALRGRAGVRLGRRWPHVPGGALGGSKTTDLFVNRDEVGAPGELLHEGADPSVANPTRYNEYFFPIPQKCVGDLRRDFWRKNVTTDQGKQRLALLRAHLASRGPRGAGRGTPSTGAPRGQTVTLALSPAQAALHEQRDFLGEAKSLARKVFTREADLGRTRQAASRQAAAENHVDPEATVGRSASKGSGVRATTRHPEFGDVALNFKDPGLGYYELLHRCKEQSNSWNVLVGYSQGGTIARYLAYLDEHVVDPDKRCIHAIFTAHAPNHGSPVASPENADAVVEALLSGLLSLGALHGRRADPMKSPLWNHVVDGLVREGRALPVVTGLIDASLASLRKANDPRKELVDSLRTARKWLSGLSGFEGSAFWDLAPEAALEPGSVLHSIAEHPLERTYHGAVIGLDDDLARLVSGLAPRGLRGLATLLLRRWLDDAGRFYREHAMRFGPGAPPALARDHRTGLRASHALRLDHAIPPHAHDFVVPAVSQLLRPADGDARFHLGNRVNVDASHGTGADLSDTGDRTTGAALVAEFLARMPLPAPADPARDPEGTS